MIFILSFLVYKLREKSVRRKSYDLLFDELQRGAGIIGPCAGFEYYQKVAAAALYILAARGQADAGGLLAGTDGSALKPNSPDTKATTLIKNAAIFEKNDCMALLL
ncbi:MAG: hypothetical protein K6G71_03655 [Clostridiales bacterium]|nr:hypothetical protein [Clostridiales bacterium]